MRDCNIIVVTVCISARKEQHEIILKGEPISIIVEMEYKKKNL